MIRSFVFGMAVFALAPSFAQADPLDTAHVVVRKLETTEESDELLFPARVQSAVQTKIFAESEGVVRLVPVHVGQAISKRDRVMTVQHTDPVYQYAPVKITSPVGGIVSSLEVTEGTNVTKGQWLATVTDPARLKIQIEIPAQDLPKILTGMTGEFRASAEAAPRTVRVLGVSPLVDAKTGTAPADLAFAEAKRAKGAKPSGEPLAVLPGTLGQVVLKANLHPALLVPEDALVYRDGKTMVRKLEGDKMKLTAVEIGDRRRGSVEVKKGVSAGDRVITRSSRFVSDGEAVKIDEEKTADEGAANAAKAKT
ncbi:MAG: HlyD family efflux transporter periplasmic adaptor subunit [Bdellovibrionales bacterium]|nr:HlyD family efflux transporter periplasmic adaptor subunit [Bdellovibrionales bacterium]